MPLSLMTLDSLSKCSARRQVFGLLSIAVELLLELFEIFISLDKPRGPVPADDRWIACSTRPAREAKIRFAASLIKAGSPIRLILSSRSINRHNAMSSGNDSLVFVGRRLSKVFMP
jgi:hypothetical protein